MQLVKLVTGNQLITAVPYQLSFHPQSLEAWRGNPYAISRFGDRVLRRVCYSLLQA